MQERSECAQVPWSCCRGQLAPPKLAPGLSSATDIEALTANAMRMTQRFVGHCNMRTDIKEAIFVGDKDEVVACGSDRGHVLLFDSHTGELLRLLWADTEVANRVQCHPTLPVLATSGLEDVVRFCFCPHKEGVYALIDASSTSPLDGCASLWR